MHRFQTADHRHLAWHEWGASGGKPVIFCSGAGMAGALPFGQREAEQLGLRIISVDRPGLGNSDPDYEKSFDRWTQDVRELLTFLNLRCASALGFSQGAPFALALASAGLADVVSVVSGQDELAYPSVLDQLPEPVAQMVRRATSNPAALEAEIAATANPDWLWQMIETMSGEQDRAFYGRDDFAPQYRAALAEGFRQGASGYARDTVLAMAPWPFRVEDLACPVHLWFGLEDTSPVHSPDFGETLSHRIPTAKLTRIDSEGSAILWTQANDILAALRSEQ